MNTIIKKIFSLRTTQIIASGFMGVIILGAFVLWLPICNTQPIRFIDSLFTATTCVCVTGLMTVTAATQFTIIGKIVLLVLIQIGGLGVVACAVSVFLIVRKKITVRERVIIQEAYNLDTLQGMVNMIIQIIKGTFVAELIGAILYSFKFIPEFGWIKGIGYSIFHSVSAFCNAGVDILGENSLSEYVTSPLVSFTTIALIVMGGIGFVVWSDVYKNAKKTFSCGWAKRNLWTKLQLHSKIAITMTLWLIAGGTLLFFLFEHKNVETMGNLSLWQKWMASLFHSVTTRTAGFYTVPQKPLTEQTKLISCLLMFIGGSPAGTAGGVKTTTMAMLLLTCWAGIRGGRDTECFGRKISERNVRTGWCVVMVAFVFLLVGTTLVTSFEHMTFIDVFYECTSAIGTVGLSAGLTPYLSRASKIVIIILMYAGRIGPITIALVFGTRKKPIDDIRSLPETKIIVG